MNDQLTTLPRLAQRWDLPLDSLRALIRRWPHLRVLGRRMGPTRVFSPADAEAIHAAWRERHPVAAARE
jgi:hypothetical protein